VKSDHRKEAALVLGLGKRSGTVRVYVVQRDALEIAARHERVDERRRRGRGPVHEHAGAVGHDADRALR
jgi:hypothetical protein